MLYLFCKLFIENEDKKTTSVHISKDIKKSTDELLNGTPTDLNGTNVYVGYSKSSLCAAFYIDDVEFYVRTTRQNQDAFEYILIELTNQID